MENKTKKFYIDGNEIKNTLFELQISINKFVDENPESELIDYIFSIKILNPYKLPKSNDLYERFALRLLIKESNKHPLTRETLILEELEDRKSTRLNSSHVSESRMPSSA